jgi:hypothetical protein
MARIAVILGALAVATTGAFAKPPGSEVPRVFVSGSGSDSNACTFVQPCRTFQQAFNTAPADAEIDVLDSAGYGPLTITHGISIQGHGFGSITGANNSNAITVNARSRDSILINGLLLDGSGKGLDGIDVITAGSVQILNCVIRHFAAYGIDFVPANNPMLFSVSNTIASDNGVAGVVIEPQPGAENSAISLDAITATGNGGLGLYIAIAAVMVNHSNLSNNSNGLFAAGSLLMVKNSALSNNGVIGLQSDDSTVWLTKNTIYGNGVGIYFQDGIISSYLDNDINGNINADVSGGSLTTVPTQ